MALSLSIIKIYKNWQLKVSGGLSPEIVNELFQFKEQIPYHLIQRPQCQISWVHSVFSGTESLKFLGPKIWALVLNEMKQLGSLGKFRNAIKKMETYILSSQTMQKINS